MKKSIAVVIPYYHGKLTNLENISYKQCLKVLYKYDIILVVPDNMKKKDYPNDSGIIIKRVPAVWMDSVSNYNTMMLTLDFYKRFQQYEYILIYQLDAFVFVDQLEKFCEYGYDYIGAPWLFGVKCLFEHSHQGVWYVGNGGLSLRKVYSFLNRLRIIETNCLECPEDVFWASQNGNNFNVAPFDIALQFAFERDVEKCFLLNGKCLPFGCHAWEKHDFDFWRPFFENEGYFVGKIEQKGHDNFKKNENFLYLEIKSGIILNYCNHYFKWESKQIFLWGCGNVGKEFGWLLNKMGIRNFAYVDVDEKKWHNMVFHTFIYPTEKLENLARERVVVIITVKEGIKEILQILGQYGYKFKKNIFVYGEWKNDFEKAYSGIDLKVLY